MTDTTTTHEIPHLKPRLLGIVLVVAAIAGIGVLLVSRFAALDYNRDMRGWQDKLNLIADSRANDVTQWVDGNFTELKKLADNPSLQLYFTELKAMPETKSAKNAEPPQQTYLRNLLIFTADRMGFAPTSVPLSLQIPTQIPYEASDGLAVLDNDNNIIVHTPFLTTLDEQLRTHLRNIPPSVQTLLDIQKSGEGKAQIGFIVPVFGIQADPTTSEQMGRILGVKQVDESFFKLLKHPGLTEKTLEAELVRMEGDNIVYLSPLADGSAPLEKQLKNNAATLAEAFAATNPGSFSEKRDYQSKNVLVTGRSIPGTPWTLVVKIDREEALAESDVRRNGMIALLLTILALIVATVVAVWYVSSSRRAINASRYFRDMAERSTAQERLLKLVTDNQPEALYILDEDEQYRFVNRVAAKEAGMHPGDMLGKEINDVLGTARAEDTVENARNALHTTEPLTHIKRVNNDGEERIIRCEYVPLEQIPIPNLGRKTPGVLVVEHDISEVVHEREKRLRGQRQLVDTLVMLVDERDPHAANHSLLVSHVSFEVAVAMEQDLTLCETARLAGMLMNIGKIVVPEQMLTKRESLNDSEKQTIRESILASAELLEDITFEGPVVDTLKQAQEHWDGTGPEGLKGDGILITARIVAVANAFIGMISPRSYRAALSIDTATKLLLEEVDTKYDRRVVVSLVNFIENQGGRALLRHWDEQMKGAA